MYFLLIINQKQIASDIYLKFRSFDYIFPLLQNLQLSKNKLKDYISSFTKVKIMKIKSSLKSIKKRDLNSKLVRRRGRVYVINKTNPKFKARQK